MAPTPTLAARSEFRPLWGSEHRQYWRLAQAARDEELAQHVEKVLAAAERLEPDSVTDERVLFSYSVLDDVLRAGGTVTVRDSRIFVAWPEWRGKRGREAARRALLAAREGSPATPADLERVRPLFAPSLDGPALARVMAEARFELVEASARHPTGLLYAEAFRVALQYWTMPYRGRAGRMKRFVLTATHESLGEYPVVAGILELGDEAPFCNWRDDLIGLTRPSLLHWLRQDPEQRAETARRQLREIRGALLPLSDGSDLANLPASAIAERRAELQELASGRSKVADHELELLKDRKRLIYALRLADGEIGLEAYPRRPRDAGVQRALGQGVRAIHDLMVPRMHMEATVLGAIPPFGAAYGGKLLVSFLGHPSVIAASRTGIGELVSWAFDVGTISALLPDDGLKALTTKGLYAEHSPLYNRSSIPGTHGKVPLRHLANTEGTTTTFLSQRTVRFARRVVEGRANGEGLISSVYGSGGAKRHRLLESAAIAVGLDKKIINAGIRRPVYGTSLIANPAGVSWGGESPSWLLDTDCDPAQAAEAATQHWRGQWLEKASRRVEDYIYVPSIIVELSNVGAQQHDNE